MLNRSFAGALIGLLAMQGEALAEALTVRVDAVASAKGNVLVAVCTPDTFLTDRCPYTAQAPAQAGRVDVVVAGVPPGRYALQVFHDANANMDLDRTFIGFPQEGLGFSNDAPMRYGPPKFADAAISVTGAEDAARLTMRYY